MTALLGQQSWVAPHQIVAGKTLFAAQTPYQLVEVFRDEDGVLTMTLDGFWQFDEVAEGPYHDALVNPAMLSAKRLGKVLIAGGGDGLAARNVLAYPDVGLVNVELDPMVVHVARRVGPVSRLNRVAFSDPRADVRVGDAVDFARDSKDQFDVVLCDFPDPITLGVGRLFTEPVIRSFADRLAPGGTMAWQASWPRAPAYGQVWKTFERLGFDTRGVAVVLPRVGPIGVILGNRGGLRVRRQPNRGEFPRSAMVLSSAFERRTAWV